jgi:hypothetical protein
MNADKINLQPCLCHKRERIRRSVFEAPYLGRRIWDVVSGTPYLGRLGAILSPSAIRHQLASHFLASCPWPAGKRLTSAAMKWRATFSAIFPTRASVTSATLRILR